MSDAASAPRTLGELLERLQRIDSRDGRASLDDVLDELGRRAFGPLLLLAGIVTMVPVIGGIPGVPTVMAGLVLLVAVQLLLQRQAIWLPRWLLERSIALASLHKACAWLMPPARVLDTLLRQRWAALVGDHAVLAIAICCIGVALMMPPMELVPFSANGAGLALSGFGLALMAKDGLMALLAFAVSIATLIAIVAGLS
ncbi:exopolysaccharide biosynthesis protein [Franzmannia qiaohouensis]|uniref:Exopolysaccharide biosynthesis protein n=1 Tax=Franzmannia qiaohouensis TaxID=1329370 RepID=A0ABU1HF92_9GAMM|nr:exopolysaccharide biosynthesis protein [Halomonas qiaohouensis]MDR5906145.1 exopolysaccharide biosynthesis protein [Halomonas qiaohouensis]